MGSGMMGQPMFGGQMGQGMRDGPEGRPMNPCEMNPNDPFCKGGMDFGKMQEQYEFNTEQFNPEEYAVKNLKQEVRNLKTDAKRWERDIKDITKQLTEISRESSGFACPPAMEVQTIAQQWQNAIDTVKGLSETAPKETIQEAFALRDFVQGKWEYDKQFVTGLQQKLFGGSPDPDTGVQTPGKMQSINVCREISGVIHGANDIFKNLSREQTRAKKAKAPDVVLKSFEETLPKLQQLATNPLAVLQTKGVTFEELTKPWPPQDPDEFEEFQDKCGEFMMGGGPGFGPMMGGAGFGPPMEGFGFGPMMGGSGGSVPKTMRGSMGPGMMQSPGMQGPGPSGSTYGQPNFGPMPFSGDFSPEMQKMMEQKMKQMYEGGQMPMFNPYGASVLTAQSDEDFGDDEDMEGFGPQKIPDE